MKMSFEQSIPDLFLKKWFWLRRRGFGEEARTVSSAAVHYQGQPGRSLPRPARTLTAHTVGRGTHRKFSHESWSRLEALGQRRVTTVIVQFLPLPGWLRKKGAV